MNTYGTKRRRHPALKPLSAIKHALLIGAGTLSLLLGIVGAFLPVLPTTPFVLVAALCYIRSSERMYRWLMNSRFAGNHLRSILDGKGIPLSVKIFSLTISAVMIGYVSVYVTQDFFLRMLLGLLYLAQFMFMLCIKTLRHKTGPGREALQEKLTGSPE
jgi:uncharacterized membrane protein YbaN (DUF454 family)